MICCRGASWCKGAFEIEPFVKEFFRKYHAPRMRLWRMRCAAASRKEVPTSELHSPFFIHHLENGNVLCAKSCRRRGGIREPSFRKNPQTSHDPVAQCLIFVPCTASKRPVPNADCHQPHQEPRHDRHGDDFVMGVCRTCDKEKRKSIPHFPAALCACRWCRNLRRSTSSLASRETYTKARLVRSVTISPGYGK